MADGGHYVPRAKETTSAESFLSSMRVNQHTGLIDPAWMIAASKQTATAKDDAPEALYWISMGPDNLGGKTTAIVYDNQNPGVVYIGSMGGGVFRSTNHGISWRRVGENMMVRCMVQAQDGTIYVGTGDGNNSVNNNSLTDYDYGNSFVGSGLYTINDNTISLVEGTTPAVNAVDDWSFINDLAVDGNKVIVATPAGVRYLEGNDWLYAQADSADLKGSALKVRVTTDHKIVASVDGKLYVGSLSNMVCLSGESGEVIDSTGIMTHIAPAPSEGLLDVAVAPSDDNVIYAATIDKNGNHVKIYASYDQGASWSIILLPSAQQDVYGGGGMVNHNLVVDPKNSNRFYVLGEDLWRLDRPSNQTGYYLARRMSKNNLIHGINDLQFDPSDALGNHGYIATDGGIYKFNKNSDEYFSYVNCNRNYISTRCLNVAVTSNIYRVVAGVLDHAPVLIRGEQNTNNMRTCELLLPELAPANDSTYDKSNISASSVVSSISPNTMIITTKDGGILRSETSFVDKDETQFTANQTFSFSGYRMPLALYENFNDEKSVSEVWFKCTRDQKAGDVVYCHSHNGSYPFAYTLPHDMHFNVDEPSQSDSILVHDPISAKFYAPSGSSTACKILVTFDALVFDKSTDWYQLATINSNPTCFEISADGDVLFIGTKGGSLFRISNLNEVIDANTASYTSNSFSAQVTEISLPVDGQCVTSVSIFNEDNNKVVVTLGNYGNNSYVLYSDNALDSEPVFVSKQGNLNKMPVYSSVYTVYRHKNEAGVVDKEEEHVLIGTEHGIFRTTNIDADAPVWISDGFLLGDVPVLDLKQQHLSHPDQHVVTVIDSVPTVTVVPGVNNCGVIYAATYGGGLFRCENYHTQYSGTNVQENPAVAAKSEIRLYPNPVRDAATVSFELSSNATVSYQVYDLSGRIVKTERLGNYGEGKHEINVSVEGFAKGAYVLRLNAGSQTSNVKFMVF